MPITVESFLSGDEVLKSRSDPYSEGEVVYFVERSSGEFETPAPIVKKGTIQKPTFWRRLEEYDFALAVWDDPRVEPTNRIRQEIRAPYCVLTEQEVLLAIVKAGGLIRADSDRTVDQLVMSPTGNDELASILEGRLAEKLEF